MMVLSALWTFSSHPHPSHRFCYTCPSYPSDAVFFWDIINIWLSRQWTFPKQQRAVPYLVYHSCVIYNDCDPLRPQCTWHTDCLYSSVLIPVVLQRLYASYDLHPLSTHLQHWSWTKLRPPAAPSDTVSRAFNRSPTCDRVGSVRGILVLILRVLVLASVQWC